MPLGAAGLYYVSPVSQSSQPVGGAHHNYDKAAAYLKLEILKQLEELSGKSVDKLIEQRYHHFRDVRYFGEAKA